MSKAQKDKRHKISCEVFRADLDVENKMVIPEAEEAMGKEGGSTVDP